VGRIKSCISSTIDRHPSKDEEESVSYKGSRALGEAKRTAEVFAKEMLAGVISHCEACSNTYNVLSASTPEVLINRSSNKLVEVTIVHLYARYKMSDVRTKDKRSFEHQAMASIPSV
jgi:hypothetical protein